MKLAAKEFEMLAFLAFAPGRIYYTTWGLLQENREEHLGHNWTDGDYTYGRK